MEFLSSLILLQIFCYDLFEIIRRHSSTAKVLVSLPASILSIYALSGPFDHDSHGEMNRRVQDYMKETGKPLVEAAQAVCSDTCPPAWSSHSPASPGA